MKAVPLYIIKNSNEDKRDVYSVVKSAYYALQLHFAKWVLPMYKDIICALPFGPVPSMRYNFLKLSREEVQERGYFHRICMDRIAEAVGCEYELFYAGRSGYGLSLCV